MVEGSSLVTVSASPTHGKDVGAGWGKAFVQPRIALERNFGYRVCMCVVASVCGCMCLWFMCVWLHVCECVCVYGKDAGKKGTVNML